MADGRRFVVESSEDFVSMTAEQAAEYRRDFADWQGWEVPDDASATG